MCQQRVHRPSGTHFDRTSKLSKGQQNQPEKKSSLANCISIALLQAPYRQLKVDEAINFLDPRARAPR